MMFNEVKDSMSYGDYMQHAAAAVVHIAVHHALENMIQNKEVYKTVSFRDVRHIIKDCTLDELREGLLLDKAMLPTALTRISKHIEGEQDFEKVFAYFFGYSAPGSPRLNQYVSLAGMAHNQMITIRRR